MSSTYDPLVGQVLDDRYEILAKVARGGMATVYRARDTRLTRVVAVKIMRSDLGEDDEFAAKFDREARAAATINHPAVVGVFDQGIAEGQPYIVMEYVDGETLRRRISREAPLPPDEALELLEPVVAALACAHEHGLVHRDIKPENVLLSTRGQVKVADFGLARLTSAPQMTATGVLVGTASYLPPELVTHSRPTARSDVYSTGVMLFEMLTGKKPHTGENNYQIAYRHVNVDIEPPSQRLRELGHRAWRIPDHVDALVRAATARNPDDRLSDARMLLDRLRQVRTRLARDASRDDPALAAALTPRPSRDGDVTVQISPRGVPRPRPAAAGAPATATSPVARSSVAVAYADLTPTSPTDQWEPVRGTPRTVARQDPIPHRGEDSLRERLPKLGRTPVFPTITISKDPVHRRRRGVLLVLLLLIVTLAVGFGSWWWAEGRFTTAPALVSTPSGEAEASAGASDLRISDAVEEYSETVPAGVIIRTEPEAGTRLLRGEGMTVYISLGPERYAMPQVEGLDLDAATEAITGQNLAVGEVTTEFSESVVEGVVISASEPEGTALKRDHPIGLVVSEGPPPITIPDHTGRDAATAAQELEAAGFTVEVTEEHSSSVAAGLVITQSPNSGTGFRDDQVSIVKSLGPVMVEVPDVRYQSTDEAVRSLENQGFNVEKKYLTDLPLALNIASGTEPGRGASVPEGSTVVLLIA